MMAVRQGHNEVADVLLEAGADVNLQSNDVSWQSRQPKVTTFTRSSVCGKGRYGSLRTIAMLHYPFPVVATEGEKDGTDACCKERNIFYRKVATETQTRCEHQRLRKLK